MVRNKSFWKLASVALVLTASIGLATAEPIRGRITSIEGNKLTATVGAKKGEKGEAKTFDLAPTVKVNKGGKDGKTEVADGLKAAEFKNIDAKKGLSAVLEVNNNTVTEITLTGGGTKKKN
jgi:hypothetical protein